MSRAGYLVLLVGLVALLVLQVLTPGRSGDPAAAYRLVVYPPLALALPAGWWARRRPTPWGPASLVVLPLLLDTVGNVAGLYGRVAWWDDASHLVHWLLIGSAVGLLLEPVTRPRWALVLCVTGFGAGLAVVWELFEQATFYTGDIGPSVYTDTLADQALGTAGALLGGLLVLGWSENVARAGAGA